MKQTNTKYLAFDKINGGIFLGLLLGCGEVVLDRASPCNHLYQPNVLYNDQPVFVGHTFGKYVYYYQPSAAQRISGKAPSATPYPRRSSTGEKVRKCPNLVWRRKPAPDFRHPMRGRRSPLEGSCLVGPPHSSFSSGTRIFFIIKVTGF